jgi:hypothetical protein
MKTMDAQIRDVLLECTKASDEERVTFAEVVKKLIGAGVERYHADLLRSEKTYYLPNGESEVVPSHAVGIVPSQEFSAQGVDAAVRAIQAGKFSTKPSASASRRRVASATSCRSLASAPSTTGARATVTLNGSRGRSKRAGTSCAAENRYNFKYLSAGDLNWRWPLRGDALMMLTCL